MTTKSVCERKSKGSLKFSKDFWTFYLANQTEVDRIVSYQVHELMVNWHARNIEAHDVEAEVLELLRTRNFLDEWNPKKSALNTYLTVTARFYATHVLEREFRHNKLIPNARYAKDRVILHKEDQGFAEIDLMTSVHSVLNTYERCLLQKKIMGYTNRAIADELGKSEVWISLKVRGLREKVGAICSE